MPLMITRLLALICLLATLPLYADDDLPSAGEVAEFASDVVFKYKRGSDLMHARRWHGEVTVVVITDDDYDEMTLINPVLDEFNLALKGTDFKLVRNDKHEPWTPQTITFIIGDRGFRNKHRRRFDCEGNFHSSQKDKQFIRTRSVIFIAPDEYSEEAFQTRMRRGLLGVMGMPDRSDEIKESILHTSRRNEELSTFDKSFINFYHTHVKEGMTRQEVKDAVREHWDD